MQKPEDKLVEKLVDEYYGARRDYLKFKDVLEHGGEELLNLIDEHPKNRYTLDAAEDLADTELSESMERESIGYLFEKLSDFGQIYGIDLRNPVFDLSTISSKGVNTRHPEDIYSKVLEAERYISWAERGSGQLQLEDFAETE